MLLVLVAVVICTFRELPLPFGLNHPIPQDSIPSRTSAGTTQVTVGVDTLSRGQELTTTGSLEEDIFDHYPTGGHRLFVKGDYWTTSTSGEVTFHTPRPSNRASNIPVVDASAPSKEPPFSSAITSDPLSLTV